MDSRPASPARPSAPKPRYSSTFIFETKHLSEEFHRIDDEIAERARRIPGFLGEEAWHNEDTGLHAEVYYWSDLDALRQLVGMDTHLIAKRRHGEYRVVISEVRSVYGDPLLGIEHVPAPEPAAMPDSEALARGAAG